MINLKLNRPADGDNNYHLTLHSKHYNGKAINYIHCQEYMANCCCQNSDTSDLLPSNISYESTTHCQFRTIWDITGQ